jgi:hypothetical protein
MKIELDLLDNGLDFIIEGLKPTTKIWGNTLSDNKWKYSVLNIFSGIELILKEKLKREHWSLIFQDVSNANQQKLIQGDFISVSHSDVIKRLREICNVSIDDIPIDALRRLRNKFEHFEINITIDECKQIIATALREVLVFIDNHILTIANEKQIQKVEQIKNMLFEFDTFVANQLTAYQNAIKGIISSNSGKLIHCKNCNNESFIVFKDPNKEYKCFVCNKTVLKNDFLNSIRVKEEEDLSEENTLLKHEEYNHNCNECGGKSRVKFSPSYFLVSTEYKPDYFICLDCLDFKTSVDIRNDAFEKEIEELEKSHSKEDFIKILQSKLKE